MNCPRCAVPLRGATPDAHLAELKGQECPACRGVWLDQDVLHRLEQVVEVVWVEFRHLPPPVLQAEVLTCPRCAPTRHLGKVESARDRNVVMDVCQHCRGVWLDGGELRAIQQKGLVPALVDAVRFVTQKRP